MEDTENKGEIREEDTMKILLATDCHLGYEHSTKRRKNQQITITLTLLRQILRRLQFFLFAVQENDSFITFEEILKLALKHDVDLLLLGGDLFHDSKPSQKVILQCMELLKKYALGER